MSAVVSQRAVSQRAVSRREVSAGAVSRRAALAAAMVLGSPLRALAEAPDRRPPPAGTSAIQAAEFEAQPWHPAAAAIDMPILVYHHVVPDHSPGALYVTPDGFEQQLKYLRDNGYRSISFADLADALEFGAKLPERPVILSFDDGWENQFRHGFPLLQKYGFSGTFYIVSGYLDHQNFMTTEQLNTMMAAGMVVGSHSRTHPALAGFGGARLKDEVAGSKAWLEDHFGIAIDTFAYPYGSYTAAVAAATKAAGYRTARTVDIGTRASADNLATLPAILFPAYLSRYRATIELAANR
jgi:peptidoglycan/xylan/chitin deacetylase (PgdA/CDA1 family)